MVLRGGEGGDESRRRGEGRGGKWREVEDKRENKKDDDKDREKGERDQ